MLQEFREEKRQISRSCRSKEVLENRGLPRTRKIQKIRREEG